MKKEIFFYGLIGIFFTTLLFCPNYNLQFLNSGIFYNKDNSTIEDIAANSNILFEKEGLYGTIVIDEKDASVVEVKNEGVNYKLKINDRSFYGNLRTLKINGKIHCGNGRVDMTTTGLLGGLPILFGKEGEVLNIGLGCGLTLGILEKGNFNIDSVEIDPVIIEAAKNFNDIHEDALYKPNSDIIIDDARNYLLKTNKKYDVIINEPTPPSVAGSTSLFSREFFLLMKEHLKDDGVVIQWMMTTNLRSCDSHGFAAFYKTFSSVFPYNYVFISKTQIPMIQPTFTKDKNGEVKAGYNEFYDYPDPRWRYGEMIIIGSSHPIDIKKYFDNFDERKDGIKEYFKKIRIIDLRDYYLFSNEEVAGFSDNVQFNTDDKPVIEFLAAKNLYISYQSECDIWQGIEFKD